MREIMTYLNYLGKIPAIFKTTFSHPVLLTPLISIIILNNQILAILLLIFFLIADYATGVMAAWVEAKKQKETTKWFSSEKTRLSIIKSVSYMLFILGCFAIEKIFLVKKFNFTHFSEADFTLTLMACAICICIEFYSIFWENLPKAGVDIPGYVNKIIGKIKEIKTSVKSINNDDNS